MNKKTIELLKDVNYFEAHAARNIRPFPPSQITGQPPAEMTMLDNSVQYPQGARLEVELDAERQELEPLEGKTWFRNASHPGGFQVPNSDFRYVDPPAE
jgi:hypothetical protein